MTPIDTTFYFAGLYGCASHCRARVFGAGAAPVVLLTELADNDGTSVTNGVETIAAQLCDFYRLDGADVVVVEHYPDSRTPVERAANLRDPIFQERFAAVNFGFVAQGARGWHFSRPRWAPLAVAQLEALIGSRWAPESR